MNRTTTDDEPRFDFEVRRHVYDHTMRAGAPPASAEAAAALGASDGDVRASLRRLEEAHVFVLQDASGEILMAPPFSAVPTPFLVSSGGVEYYANCAWDALGVPVALGRDASVEASCACCGTRARLSVEGDRLTEGAGEVVHFALPARRWWENVVFT